MQQNDISVVEKLKDEEFKSIAETKGASRELCTELDTPKELMKVVERREHKGKLQFHKSHPRHMLLQTLYHQRLL